MNKFLLLVFLLFGTVLFAQSPAGFNYQVIVRDANGLIISNQSIGLSIKIRQGNFFGTVVFDENSSHFTNDYGLINHVIGSGNILVGNLGTIPWENGPFFIETGIDLNGGTSFVSMGTTELVSTPFAMYASKAGNVFSGDFNDLVNIPNWDTSSVNEIQQLQLNGDTLSLSGSNYIVFAGFTGDFNSLTNVPPLDTSVTNELQALSLVGDTLKLSNGGYVLLPQGFDGQYSSLTGAPTNVSTFTNDAGYLTTEVDGSVTNELQALSLVGDTLKLSNGGYVLLPQGFDGQYSSLTGAPTNVSTFTNDAGYLTTEVDGSVTNELQALSLVGDTLKLSNGGYVLLPQGFDSQYSSLTGVPTNVSTFTNDAGYLTTEVDGSVTNELQALSLVGDTLKLSNGGYVLLPQGFDSQYSSLTGVPTNVSTFTNDAGYLTTEVDGSVTNELQALSLVGDTLKLSNGGYVLLPQGFDSQYSSLTGVPTNVSTFTNDAGYLTTEVDGSVTNELQALSLVGDTLKLSNGGYVLLPQGFDSQYSSLTGVPTNVSTFTNDAGYLTTEVDGSVTNELQALSLVGDTLKLSNGGYVLLPQGFDGQYSSLTGAPTNVSTFTNDAGYLTTEVDGSVTNELQALSLVGDTLKLSNGGYVLLPQGFDSQYSSLTGVPTNVSTFTNDAGYLTTEVDGSVTNELQALSLVGDTLKLSNGGYVLLDGLGVNGLDDLSDASHNQTLNSIGIGLNTLTSLTTGYNNFAIGTNALKNVTSGSINTAIGDGALISNTTGSHNVAIAQEALSSNTTGGNNVAVGAHSMMNAKSGSDNIAIGASSMAGNASGSNNIAIGTNANVGDSALINAIAIGSQAVAHASNVMVLGNTNLYEVYTHGGVRSSSLRVNDSSASDNVIVQFNSNTRGVLLPRMTAAEKLAITTPPNGLMIYQIDGQTGLYYAHNSAWQRAGADTNVNDEIQFMTYANDTLTLSNGGGKLYVDLQGANDINGLSDGYADATNVALGNALTSLASGTKNTVLGKVAGGSITTSNNNVLIGYEAGKEITATPENVAIGVGALKSLTGNGGGHNVAIGANALRNHPNGGELVAIGADALKNSTSGEHNVAVGSYTLVNNTANNNTAIGWTSGWRNTSGGGNTSIGAYALRENYTGSGNVAIGSGALSNNTQSGNTAVGAGSLELNSTGSSNSALGYESLKYNSSGQKNTAIGIGSLYTNTTGSHNTAVGSQSMRSNTTGIDNTALGGDALRNNTTGNRNVSISVNSLLFNTTGSDNLAIGYDALRENTTGYVNIAIGNNALKTATTAHSNVAVGHGALGSLTTGLYNQALGRGAMPSNTSGQGNTSIGFQSMQNLTTGHHNIAIGVSTMFHNVIGSANIFIGNQSGYHTTGSSNTIVGHDALSFLGSGTGNTSLGAGTSTLDTAMSNSTAIGYGAVVSGSNTIQLGNASVVNVNTSGIVTAIGAIVTDNTTTGNAYAMGVHSTTKGFLPPRMTKVQRQAISNPVEGLMVYQTTGDKGIYYYDGSNWYWLGQGTLAN